MANKPILIIQMQRLGDLVLSYPLMGWLSRLYPDNPLWVVGEEMFFAELMELSPTATYFAYDAAPGLRKNAYRMVINLSHRPEAIALAGALDAEERIGAYRDKTTGAMFINGDWQVYRASLVNNNRYNLYHWADMNALDVVPPDRLRTTSWPKPRETAATASAHIGLFLGASEQDKHPDAGFWTALAGELLEAGHRPVLLGGEAEKPLGGEVAKALGAPALNLTGHFSVSALCRFLRELDLFVTPDTGPMHLAVWTGTPVLNISTGPVNAWETGPFSPGHFVLRAALPCVGCWHCTQGSVLCKEALHASRTAYLIHELVSKKEKNLHRFALPDQELLRTARDSHNLFHLEQIIGETPPRQVTALFWQAFFGNRTGIFTDAELRQAWKNFAEASPGNGPAFIQALVKLSKELSLHLRGSHAASVNTETFWASFPLPLRPLTSYMHLSLQNGMFKNAAFAQALELVERLISLH
ncbi:Glycosyl transferase family 9 [uncultured delta proteobacterium]|uniref:Glycosyl transferase family 9 n=1 Tax=uncultured delta proteobacterium TaxID=34034 RepID=A0A212KCF1_9DELT|nr:Glycosyl transferase family 9 [uncultured delta proteobacterium]